MKKKYMYYMEDDLSVLSYDEWINKSKKYNEEHKDSVMKIYSKSKNTIITIEKIES